MHRSLWEEKGKKSMDKKALRQSRERKRRQIRRRKIIRAVVYLLGAVLLVIFVSRGIVKPIIRRIFGSGPDDSNTLRTEAVESDPNAAIRRPLKRVTDTEKLTALTPGWHENAEGRWYQNTDRTYFAGGFMSIDGVQYYFNEDGYIVRDDWITLGVKDYYFDETGSLEPQRNHPLLALTFDDGPGPYTNRLLDALEKYNARATFFMLGIQIEEYPDILPRMQELGCELGSHTWNHKDLTTLSLEGVKEQFRDTDDLMLSVCGQTAKIARPPYGSWNDDVLETAGKPFINWCVDSMDWSYKDAQKDYESILSADGLGDGAIILMHDIYEPTVACVEMLIPKLQEMGYKLVTVSELAEASNVDLQLATYTNFWKSSLEAGDVPGYRGTATTESSYEPFEFTISDGYGEYREEESTEDTEDIYEDESEEEEYQEEDSSEAYDEEYSEEESW